MRTGVWQCCASVVPSFPQFLFFFSWKRVKTLLLTRAPRSREEKERKGRKQQVIEDYEEDKTERKTRTEREEISVASSSVGGGKLLTTLTIFIERNVSKRSLVRLD